MPVAIPAGVDVSIKEDQINVKGTGGTLSLQRNALVKVVTNLSQFAQQVVIRVCLESFCE